VTGEALGQKKGLSTHLDRTGASSGHTSIPKHEDEEKRICLENLEPSRRGKDAAEVRSPRQKREPQGKTGCLAYLESGNSGDIPRAGKRPEGSWVQVVVIRPGVHALSKRPWFDDTSNARKRLREGTYVERNESRKVKRGNRRKTVFTT